MSARSAYTVMRASPSDTLDPSFLCRTSPAPLSAGAPAALATATTALLDMRLTNPDLSDTMSWEKAPGTMSSERMPGAAP